MDTGGPSPTEAVNTRELRIDVHPCHLDAGVYDVRTVLHCTSNYLYSTVVFRMGGPISSRTWTLEMLRPWLVRSFAPTAYQKHI